jgi:group I intron endonuclease
MAINRALFKYGYSNFTLEIIEYCEPSDVIVREQFYLDLLKPEYNILVKAGSSFGYQHSE